jgi:acetyltransferase
MNRLFEPRAIAIIGASSNPRKIGHRIVENIVSGGYAGRIYPVNPKGGAFLNLQVKKNIDDIDDDIDVAIITIPAPQVRKVVRQCAEKNVRHCIIISSGFSEVGNRKEEDAVISLARKHGMRVLGPNVFGIYVARSRLNATFGPKDIRAGNIAIITQSGALGIAMIGKSAAERIGVSAVLSVGNKADIDESDLLEYLKDDAQTRVILMYIEGFKDGRRFVESLSALPPAKHVVAIKAGTSKRGAIAAASHTGSLAGSDAVFRGIAEQLGIMRAENIRTAFDVCRFLASTEQPAGENVVVITNGGGIGVMCADACEKHGVRLFDDVDLLSDVFREFLPDFGSCRNPVDLTGQASANDYRSALRAACDCPEIHAVIALYCETAVFNQDDVVDMVREAHALFDGKKPLVFSLFGGEQVVSAVDWLRAEGLGCFDEVYDAVASVGSLYRRYRFLAEKHERAPLKLAGKKAIGDIIQRAQAERRDVLLPHEAKEILRCAGVDVPAYAVAKTLQGALDAAVTIGYPVVMKIVSEDIVHKTEAGGVALHLENREEVMNAYQAILKNAAAHFPDARLRGVELSRMVQPGLETIAGATVDPTFGPVVMFGLGGIYVEAIGDVVFRTAPVSHLEARRMVNEIGAVSILQGVRGEKRKDIEKIADVLARISVLLAEVPELRDVEINPLTAYEQGKGVQAVDVRMLLRG